MINGLFRSQSPQLIYRSQQQELCQQKQMIYQHTPFSSLIRGEYDGLDLWFVLPGLLIGQFWSDSMKY